MTNNLLYVNRYIIWIYQRFVKQNKVPRFLVHMKTSHKSKKCTYRTLEKYSHTFYKNKQNINPACACHIYLINNIILFYLFIFKLCIRKYTQIVPFKEKSSFHFAVM